MPLSTFTLDPEAQTICARLKEVRSIAMAHTEESYRRLAPEKVEQLAADFAEVLAKLRAFTIDCRECAWEGMVLSSCGTCSGSGHMTLADLANEEKHAQRGERIIDARASAVGQASRILGVTTIEVADQSDRRTNAEIRRAAVAANRPDADSLTDLEILEIASALDKQKEARHGFC